MSKMQGRNRRGGCLLSRMRANMMESVSDSAEEIQGEVKESAEVAFGRNSEKSDIVAETVAVTEESRR